MRRLAPALPFAAFYAAVFLTLGVYLPFWPVFLESRGLTAAEIGLLLALASWVKVPGNPLLGRLADASGRRRAVLAGLALAAAAAFAQFFVVRGFWAVLPAQLVAMLAFQALMPIGDAQAMAATARGRIDYGRVRLWGSLAFILGVLGAGELVGGERPERVLWAILAALAATLLASLRLPEAARPVDERPPAPLSALLADRGFLLLLAGGSLLQASHAVYYGFSALHWRAAGHDGLVVGALWAEGVIAEVALFAVGAAAVRRFGPAGLLLAAGVGGLVRWSVLGLTTALPVLVVVQALHAATFAAAHLGALHLITRRAPAGLATTAQGIYAAAAGGIGMGTAMLAAGVLYDAVAGPAFLVMAAMSLAGALLVLPLARWPAAGQEVP